MSAGETAEVRVTRGSQPSSQGEVRSSAGLGSQTPAGLPGPGDPCGDVQHSGHNPGVYSLLVRSKQGLFFYVRLAVAT